VVAADDLSRLARALDGEIETFGCGAPRAAAGARLAEMLQIPLERLWGPEVAHFSLHLIQLSRFNSTPA